jgi:hypothetical protein
MTLPALAFGLICALLLGALFHLLVDGGPARLMLYLCLSVIGFAAGHALRDSVGWTLIPVGPLDLGFGGIGSLLFLGVGYWLSLVRVQRSSSNDKV